MMAKQTTAPNTAPIIGLSAPKAIFWYFGAVKSSTRVLAVMRWVSVHSSLKERAGVKRGLACGFASAGYLQGMLNWPRGCAFLRAGAVFVRAGWLGQGPGGARPPQAAPEASLARAPAGR